MCLWRCGAGRWCPQRQKRRKLMVFMSNLNLNSSAVAIVWKHYIRIGYGQHEIARISCQRTGTFTGFTFLILISKKICIA